MLGLILLAFAFVLFVLAAVGVGGRFNFVYLLNPSACPIDSAKSKYLPKSLLVTDFRDVFNATNNKNKEQEIAMEVLNKALDENGPIFKYFANAQTFT